MNDVVHSTLCDARQSLSTSIEKAVRKFVDTTGLVPDLTVRVHGYRAPGSRTLDPNRLVIVETRVRTEL